MKFLTGAVVAFVALATAGSALAAFPRPTIVGPAPVLVDTFSCHKTPGGLVCP